MKGASLPSTGGLTRGSTSQRRSCCCLTSTTCRSACARNPKAEGVSGRPTSQYRHACDPGANFYDRTSDIFERYDPISQARDGERRACVRSEPHRPRDTKPANGLEEIENKSVPGTVVTGAVKNPRSLPLPVLTGYYLINYKNTLLVESGPYFSI